MPLRLIPANEYRRERWRNGLGWTREIAKGFVVESPHKDVRAVAERSEIESLHKDVRVVADGSAYDWDWRLSIAEVDSDCAFSAFQGCDRVLVLLTGNGMELAFDDGETIAVEPPHGRIAFAGERNLQCRLLDGATTDFNAMVRRESCAMQVYLRPLVGSMVFFADAGSFWAIHLIGGHATIKSEGLALRLDAGDTALFDTGSDAANAGSILDGGGDLILVKIQRKTVSEPLSTE